MDEFVELVGRRSSIICVASLIAITVSTTTTITIIAAIATISPRKHRRFVRARSSARSIYTAAGHFTMP
jgi:hypothetical protein